MKGCPAALTDFSRALTAWLNRETAQGGAWGVLARADVEAWTQGGCWILAEALHRWLGAPLWAVMIGGRDWGPSVSHVVVKVGRCFLDGDGAWTAEDLVRTEASWRVQQPDIEISVAPFKASRAQDLICPVDAIQALHEGLVREFGEGRPLYRLLSEGRAR